jgi:hypothetical protein
MTMGNDEIEVHVNLIVRTFIQETIDKPTTEKDKMLVAAGTRLIINVLQNLNDLAYCAMEEENRKSR